MVASGVYLFCLHFYSGSQSNIESENPGYEFVFFLQCLISLWDVYYFYCAWRQNMLMNLHFSVVKI